MLHIDFRSKASIGGFMRKDHSECAPTERLELIQRLLLEAGKIMEDTSPLLALSFPQHAAQRAQHVNELVKASEKIAALARTAELLTRDHIGSSRPA